VPTGSGYPALAFNSSGSMLAVAFSVPGGGEVELYDVAARRLAGSPIHTSIGNPAVVFYGVPNRIGTVAFSRDGTLLAICGWVQPTMEIWSTARRTRVAVVKDNQGSPDGPAVGGVKWLAFSPDGKLLSTADLDGYVRTYSVPGYTLLDYIPQQPKYSATTLAFSPDGRELADAGGNGYIFLWSVPAGDANLPKGLVQLGTFISGSQLIDSLQFESDGMLVASGPDGVVRFWKVPPRSAGTFASTSVPALTLAAHGGGVGQVSYSASLGLLVTAGASVTRVWETDPAKVTAGFCQVLKAPVPPKLWRQYLPVLPYAKVC
jgi:WD40 repeat protein